MSQAPCREATNADLERIVQLGEEFCRHFGYRFSEAKTRAALHALLSNRPAGRIFVLEDQDVVVGYVVAAFSFSLEYGGRTAFIDEIYIQPAGRGRGLGRRALAFVADFCRAAGVNAILLEAETTNPRAAALYESAGYHSFDRRLLTKILNPETGYKSSPDSA